MQLGCIIFSVLVEQEAEYGQKVEPGYQTSMASLSNPRPPVRIYLLKVLQPPKTSLPEGDQIVKHMTLWGHFLIKQ